MKFKSLFFLSLLINSFFSVAQRTPVLGNRSYFETGISHSLSATRLSDDKFITFYKNQSGSVGATACLVVGTVSGGNITYGAKASFTRDILAFTEIVKISSTKAIAFYELNATPDQLKYRVLDIAGTSITVGPEGDVVTGDERSWQQSARATVLNNNTVVICYEKEAGSPDHLRVVAGTIAGTSISWGTPVQVQDDISNTRITRMSDNKFAIAYENNLATTAGDGVLVAGTVSGNTITIGTPQTFESISMISSVALAALSETELIVAYEDDGGTDKGRVFYATLSGTVFSFPGTISPFYASGAIGDLDVEALSDNEVLIFVDGALNTRNSTVMTGVLSGNNVTIGSEISIVTNGQADDPFICPLNSDLAVVVYTDDHAVYGSTDGGDARILTFGTTTNPEINVKGNGNDIISGDNTPNVSDFTDLGTGVNSRTFTIENTGVGTLSLGSGAVTITGADAANFSISSQPAVSVSGSSSTTFTVDFLEPTATTRIAEIHINSDDIHEYDYFYSIQATGPTVPLSVEENQLFKDLTIYPNPNKGRFVLDYSGSEQLKELQVKDILGKIIQTVSLEGFDNNQPINLSNLSKGMYFMTIESESTKATKRMIIE